MADLIWGIGSAAFLLAAVYGGFALLSSIFLELNAEVQGLYLSQGLDGGIFNSAMLLWVGISEEMIWRGSVIEDMKSKISPIFATLGLTFLYALAQAGAGNPWVVVLAFFCGIVWTSMRLRGVRFEATVLSHTLFSLLLFVFAPIPEVFAL